MWKIDSEERRYDVILEASESENELSRLRKSISAKVSKIEDKENGLRDLINAEPRHSELMTDKSKYLQLCSSLDVIGDTTSALYAYVFSKTRINKDSKADLGENYLQIYGLLQVIVVQQDALGHAAESLGSKHKRPKYIEDIRETRNNAIGHPTLRNRGKERGTAFVFIVQHKLSPFEFTIQIHRPGKRSTHKTVNVPKIIEVQLRFCCKVLTQVIDHENRI